MYPQQTEERLAVAESGTVASGIPLLEALTGMPRASEASWRASSPLVKSLVAARASVLVMTGAAVTLGGLLALPSPDADVLAWLGCLAGCLLAHAASNLFNDLTDRRLGVDAGDYFRLRYGTHVLAQGLVRPGRLLLWCLLTGGLAVLVGVWLVARVGPALIVPFLAGALLLLTYTWPLKHWGLGEPAVLLVWGPLMVGGTVLAVAGEWQWPATLVGTVFALGPTLVVFGKHLDKLRADQRRAVRTLPVCLGAPRARSWMRGLLLAQYIGLCALVAAGGLHWLALCALLALPRSRALWRALAGPVPEERPADYPSAVWPLWYSAHAFDHTRAFSLLLLSALVAAVVAEGVLEWPSVAG